MSYLGNDWIFFKKAYLSYDGSTKIITLDKYDNKETDNSAGKVWEWIDVSLDDSMIDFLQESSESDNAKMILSGKYSKPEI